MPSGNGSGDVTRSQTLTHTCTHTYNCKHYLSYMLNSEQCKEEHTILGLNTTDDVGE